MITPQEILSLVKEFSELKAEEVNISEDSALVGPNSSLDSMSLVQLCLALEEKSHTFGFNFDWTSEKAMSSMNSIFKSAETLSNEFNRQMVNNK